MDNNQEKLLENFIVEFLPPTESQRKYSGNELEYISRTLDKVFIQNFGFNLSKVELTNCFFRLGYQIFYKNGAIDLDCKKVIRTSEDNHPFIVKNYYTFFNISPKTVRQLMLNTSKLPEHTNPIKTTDTENMKIKLEIFKSKIINNLFS